MILGYSLFCVILSASIMAIDLLSLKRANSNCCVTLKDENLGDSQIPVTERREGIGVAEPNRLDQHEGAAGQSGADTHRFRQPRPLAPNPQSRNSRTENKRNVSLSLPKRTDDSHQSDEEDNSSPPPHSSGTTTVASTTPTSTGTACSTGASTPIRAHRISGKVADAPSASLTHGLPLSQQKPVGTGVVGKSSSLQQELAHGDYREEWVSSPASYARPSSTSDLSNPDAISTSQHDTTDQSKSSSSFMSAVKLLVSNNVAGSIIGRSGQTISDLQAQSSTRIKLSQTGDYYPGTQDRVCLIQGNPENVKTATSLVLTRLYALQQQQHVQNHAWHNQQQQGASGGLGVLGVSDTVDPNTEVVAALSSTLAFAFVVKLLVPTPSCGMIIGKGGSNIKQMVEESGVSSVRLAPKEGGNTEMGGPVGPYAASANSAAAAAAMASATAERVVTITGPDLNSCIKCMFIILDGMTAHPDICRYANMTTSYSRVLSAAHSALGAAQTAALAAATAAARVAVTTAPPNSAGSRPQDHPSPTSSHGIGASTAASMGLWDPNISQNPLGSGFEASQMSQSMFVDPVMSSSQTVQSAPLSPHLQTGTHVAYSPVFGRPAPTAPTYLPSSPADVPASAFQHSPSRQIQSPSYLVPMAQSQTRASPSWMVGDAASQTPGTVSASSSAPDLLAMQLHESARISDLHHPSFLPSGMMDSTPSGFQGGVGPQVPPAPTSQPQGFTAQVAVPDSLIGSILGRGGRTLNDLQVLSNTRIRISQRGEFVPGTKNRIVTIRGPTAQSVASAQFLMSQRMVLPPTAVLGAGTSSPQRGVFPLQPITPEQRGSYEMAPTSAPASVQQESGLPHQQEQSSHTPTPAPTSHSSTPHEEPPPPPHHHS